MPVHSDDPIQAARELYTRMVEDLITDVQVEGGYTPQLNFSALVEMVGQQPKAAQVATQMLGYVKDEADKPAADLHGTWLMMALLANFGPDDEGVRMTRQVAPHLYEAAMLQFEQLQQDQHER